MPTHARARGCVIARASGREHARAPVERTHFHAPNEFSEFIAGAARMGLKPFGKVDR